ncbi:MAG: hypothetical protein AAGA46_00315 [Cyanobacteria bacterium P01_F01_bin.13]
MPIKVINLAAAQFADVNGNGRFLYGCPLTERETLSDALLSLKEIGGKNADSTIAELLELEGFCAQLEVAAKVTGLDMDWLWNGEKDLIFELMIGYEKDGSIYCGDVESIEFGYRYATAVPANPPLDMPKQTKFFDELWFYDCLGCLRKITDLDIYQCERFGDLNGLLSNMIGERSIGEAWDAEPLIKEIVSGLLALFGLSPDVISASMAEKLLISDEWLPGYLHQLLTDRPSKDAKPLPPNESPLHAAIAGFVSEHYPLNVAIESLKGVSQKRLNGIIKSRNRMIEEAQAAGKKGLTKEEADKHRQNIESALGVLKHPDELRKATERNRSTTPV